MAVMVAPIERRPAPATPVVDSPESQMLASRSSAWWAAGYLAAIVLAELITSVRNVEAGVVVHLALLFVLPIHASVASKSLQPLLIALVLAPLIRVVSLAMPVAGLSQVNQYLLTSLPVAIGILSSLQVIGLSRRDVSLRFTNLPLQAAIGLLGLPIGALVYVVLQPSPVIPELSWRSAVLPALVFLVAVGFVEEMLFRGVLQTVTSRTLGEWGPWYASAVFAALHIGYLSPPHAGLMFMVGLAFAWLVARTGSFVGVALAHGVANLMVYVLIPLVVVQGGWSLPDVGWSGYARSSGPDASAVPAAAPTGPGPAPAAVGPTPVSRQAPPATLEISAESPAASAAPVDAPTDAAVGPGGTVLTEVATPAPAPAVPVVASPEAASLTPGVEPSPAAVVPSVSPTTEPERVRVGGNDRVNMRSQPSLDAEILTSLAPGTELVIGGPDEQGDDRVWRNVRLSDGRVGWVDGALIEPVVPPPPTDLPAEAASPVASPSVLPPAADVPAAQGAPEAGIASPPFNDDPVGTVRRLYQALDTGDYDTLVSLWSDRMLRLVPLDVSQLQARPPSQGLRVNRAELASIDEAAGRAVVDVDVVEVVNPATGLERRYVGSWDLVRGSSGWLLDGPRIQIVE